jgi:hypothetical protein
MLYFHSRVTNYGERCRFLHGYKKAGDLSWLKNLGYNLANLYNKVDVQTSKLVKNDTEYNVYGTYGHSYSVHENMRFADSLSQRPMCQTMEGGALGAGLIILMMMR